MILYFIILFIIVESTLLIYHFLQKRYQAADEVPKTKTCDIKECNNYMYDMIVNKNQAFTVPNDYYCTSCPFLSYSYISPVGLSIDKGSGFKPCGTREQCYEIAKI